MAVSSSDTPLYNSRILDSYLKLITERYPQVDVELLLRHAGIKRGEVADLGHWFTQRQVNLFYDKLVDLSGNPGIAREAGRFSAYSDHFLREFLLGLVGPEHVFVVINRIAVNFSRSSRFSSRKTGPCSIEVTVTYEEGVSERPCQCENRIGYFESVFLLFNLGFPQIEHDECIFKGGAVCRYHIRWQPSPASRLLLAQRLSFGLLIVSVFLLFRLSHTPYFALPLLAVLPLHLVLTSLAHSCERKSLLRSLTRVRDASEQLLAQVQENYDTALSLNEIGEAISSKMELDEILASVNQVLLKRLQFSRGIILLADDDGSALVMRSCFGFDPEQRLALQRMEHGLKGGGRKGILVTCFLDNRPVLAKALPEVEEIAMPENYAVFAQLGVKSFICVPIVCEGEPLGVLAVDDPKREGELLQRDLNLLQGVAPVIGIAVRNAMRLANERELARQLRGASEQLERRVEERTAELLQAREELELLYDSVTHDLRTPLRVIYGYGELLLDGHGTQMDEVAKEYLRLMIAGGEQMEATLDRMLDYSAVRITELKLQPVDLSALAARMLADLRVTDPRRQLAARIQQGVVVVGDEALLRSVMENLLGNAWKYTAGKEEARIVFGMQDGVCYVSDNGAGFEMEMVDRLFKPFQRLHGRDTFAGHGIGLAMVRRMLERMGGKVWGKGKPGEGATFYFTVSADVLPVELPALATGAESSHP